MEFRATHKRLTRVALAGPSQAANAIRVEADHRHVALPAAIAAGVFETNCLPGSPATSMASLAISVTVM